MDHIPGAREIRDPQAEIERLAALRDDPRDDPPWREWGVRHPDGRVTVEVDGHAFPSKTAAQHELAGCDECDGGPHVLVWRDRQQWQEAR